MKMNAQRLRARQALACHRIAVLLRLRERGRSKGWPLPQKKQQRMYRGSAVIRQAGFNPGEPNGMQTQAVGMVPWGEVSRRDAA